MEKNIEAKLRDQIKELGGVAYKWVSPGNAGVPDRIVVLPHKIVFVELKEKGNTPSKLQKAQIKRLQDMGHDVRVITGEDEVLQFLEEMKGYAI